MARTGKIYLAKNIKLDKNYKSVLNYTEAQMISLITNSSNLVYSALNYQFIRDRGTIQVNAPYSQVIQANYMAFQNPDYSNKYFFAFIDEVKYLSPNASEIVYTIDIWSTWWSYWSPKACFVVREHVIDDTIGSNTVPEGLELGEYIMTQNETTLLCDPNEDFYICMAATGEPYNDFTVQSNRNYNGIFSGLSYYVFKTANDCLEAINIYSKAGKSDYIYALFMIPKELRSVTQAQSYTWTAGNHSCTIYYLANRTEADDIDVLNGTFPNHVGISYVPVNKKLYTYPFSYMNLSNNSGIEQPYYYEDFILDSNDKPSISFQIDGCVSIGMSMKAIPYNYKNRSTNYDYAITLGKLPVCSWVSDTFTNWLTQNSLNMASQFTGNITQIASGNIAAGGLGIASSLSQVYQRSLTPYQSNGNLGSGDINFSEKYHGGLELYYMSVRDEYAARIDQYFTRLGYAVNKCKVPNMSNRTNYNYVQIAQEENVAYPNNYNNICLPAKALDQINTLFRNGITIWNNHENFGDYSVTNIITQ